MSTRVKSQVLTGADIANEIRKLADQASFRIWVATPFIGSPATIRSVLGTNWRDLDVFDLRLIVDIDDMLMCVYFGYGQVALEV